jgi:hypothetical protein
MKVWKKSEKSNDKNSRIQHHSHPTRIGYCTVASCSSIEQVNFDMRLLPLP